jgi:hypothetical protein
MASVSSSRTTTVLVYGNSSGYQNVILHSGRLPGSPFGAIRDIGDDRAFNEEARAYIPFKVPRSDMPFIQSPATTRLHIYVRGCERRRGATLSLYGYADRGNDASALDQDDSSGTLLGSLDIPENATDGWIDIDVTKFAIQQVDAGNSVLAFGLQMTANPPSSAANDPRRFRFTPARSDRAAMPSLVITHTFANTTAINDKLLVGYQGWFRAPGNVAASISWAHWFNGTPSPAKEAFDS